MINYSELRSQFKREAVPSILPVLGFSLILVLLILIASCRVSYAKEIDMSIITLIESSGDVNAYNKSSGAIGLCQITPIVLVEYDRFFKTKHDKTELYVGQFNLMVADWYMNYKIPRYLKHYKIKDTVENRLRAYNSGIGTLVKGHYPQETRDYVRKYNKLAKGE